jgi:hypothetical protein
LRALATRKLQAEILDKAGQGSSTDPPPTTRRRPGGRPELGGRSDLPTCHARVAVARAEPVRGAWRGASACWVAHSWALAHACACGPSPQLELEGWIGLLRVRVCPHTPALPLIALPHSPATSALNRWRTEPMHPRPRSRMHTLIHTLPLSPPPPPLLLLMLRSLAPITAPPMDFHLAHPLPTPHPSSVHPPPSPPPFNPLLPPSPPLLSHTCPIPWQDRSGGPLAAPRTGGRKVGGRVREGGPAQTDTMPPAWLDGGKLGEGGTGKERETLWWDTISSFYVFYKPMHWHAAKRAAVEARQTPMTIPPTFQPLQPHRSSKRYRKLPRFTTKLLSVQHCYRTRNPHGSWSFPTIQSRNVWPLARCAGMARRQLTL